MLDPHGPQAARTAELWWPMLWLGLAIYLLVCGLLLGALVWRRRRRSDTARVVSTGALGSLLANGLVIAGGLIVPALVMLLLIYLDTRTLAALTPPQPALSLQVTGHQFWWEARYQGLAVANEIHIPVGQPVQVQLRSQDVIHSFWVPQLSGKTDVLPSQTNLAWLQADAPGEYLGECAEYCGTQHAHMDFLIVAEPADQFQAWLAAQQQPAQQPADPALAQGAQLFAGAGCINCHAIRYGTSAIGGVIGPDLTHVGSRRRLGAGTLENTPANMAAWIADPQVPKPGNHMPSVGLDPASVQRLAAYLEALK